MLSLIILIYILYDSILIFMMLIKIIFLIDSLIYLTLYIYIYILSN